MLRCRSTVKLRSIITIAAIFSLFFTTATRVSAADASHAEPTLHTERFENKLSPDEILNQLSEGNRRFVAGQSEHPHTDHARLIQAGSENQGDHAVVTVITCSDSRVPVERLFDAGVMDVFVIRVAGNVCDTDEIGSIEYGLAHVNTPVLVVLGHTQCGAVTAVSKAANGEHLDLELNIPALVDNIGPAVDRTKHDHPGLTGSEFVERATQENVWQSISDLYKGSPATRKLVGDGHVKVVGAVYDVGTGQVNWLDQNKPEALLAAAINDPTSETSIFAGGAANTHNNHVADSHAQPAHGGDAHAKPAHAIIELASHAEVTPVEIISRQEFEALHSQEQAAWARKSVQAAGFEADVPSWAVTLVIVLGLLVVAGLIAAQKTGYLDRVGIAPKLYGSFGTLVALLLLMWGVNVIFLKQVDAANETSHLASDIKVSATEMSEYELMFVLHGLKDKQRGEEFIGKHSSATKHLEEALTHIHEVTTEEALIENINQIVEQSNSYAKNFEILTHKFHEIETIKEHVHAINTVIEADIEEILHHHKQVLAQLEAASRPDILAIEHQSHLVFAVEEAELHWLRIYSHQSEFMLDRKISHVDAIGHELAQMYNTLEKISAVIGSDTEEARHEQDVIAEITEQVKQAEHEIALLVKDELMVDLAAASSAAAVRDIQSLADALVDASDKTMVATKSVAHNVETAMLIFGLAVGSLLSFIMARSLSSRIRETVTVVSEIVSTLDMTRRVPEKGADEMTSVSASINKLLDTTQSTLKEVALASNEVAAASTEIAATSEEIAHGMSQQTGRVNEVSSAIEEMAASVMDVADKANSASRSAEESGESATKGVNIVEETVHGMNEINEAVQGTATAVAELGKRGEQIGQIIEVINDIADQTNLLALNAAIEAARAGEHGRGFAVVADEVRKLADRTTAATDEIGESIEAIQRETTEAVKRMNDGSTKVSEGEEKASTAGDSIRTIVNSSHDVTSMVQSIAAAAQEQSTATQAVAQSSDQISSVTRETNDAVGQAAQAAGELSQRAEQLKQLVDRFQV